MIFTGFDIYDRVGGVIHRMPACNSPVADPYTSIIGGTLTEPLIRYKYFPGSGTRHRMYIAVNVQDLTSVYKFARSGMPPTSSIEHWVVMSFVSVLTGDRFWVNTFVSVDANYTVEQIHNLVCLDDADEVISGEPISPTDVYKMESFMVVYREAT